MQTLRFLYHVITDASSAVLFTLSIGAGGSILGASITHTVQGGVMGAILGTMIGAGGFGYAPWRTYRPQQPVSWRRSAL